MLLMGKGDGFFGSETLAKGIFLGSMKDARTFLGHNTVKTQGFFGGYCALYQLKSTMTFKHNLLLVWDFLGSAKNAGIFLGRQILKLGFFWV